MSLVLDKIKGKYSVHHSFTLLQIGNLSNRQKFSEAILKHGMFYHNKNISLTLKISAYKKDFQMPGLIALDLNGE